MLDLLIQRDIAAPPERVFAVASDLRGAPGRIRAITKMEVLTDGPIRIGTRFRETRKMFRREATEEMEVVAMDPPRALAFGCESNGFRYRMEMRFAPKGAGTEMQMRFQAEALTFLGRVVGALMKPFAKKMMSGCSKDLDDIAAHAEAR
jgi:uncharacterized protein YndB with AHSA1/START domain